MYLYRAPKWSNSVQPFPSPLSVSHAQVYLMTPVITNYAPHSMNTHTICFTLFHILTGWNAQTQ